MQKYGDRKNKSAKSIKWNVRYGDLNIYKTKLVENRRLGTAETWGEKILKFWSLSKFAETWFPGVILGKDHEFSVIFFMWPMVNR